MKHTISDIIGKDIISSIYSEGLLIKEMIEKIYPYCDFSQYETYNENGIELIDEMSLYEELMKNDECFRSMILEQIELYKEHGFIADDEFLNKVFVLASEYENYIDEMVGIGTLEIDNCFDYAPEIVSRIQKYDNSKRKRRSDKWNKK